MDEINFKRDFMLKLRALCNQHFLKWVMVILLTITLTILFGLHFFVPKVVSFDLQGTVSLFSSQLAKSKQQLSDSEREAKIQLFSDALYQATRVYAERNNAVVLVAPAVIAGAEDATLDIQKLTREIEHKKLGA